MEKKELINRSIDYIIQHLEEDISVEEVADYLHFSKFYFSRVFKEERGESPYAFMKRLKMDQSAIDIKLEKNKTITEIGAEYGYSSSNYSSVFKNHHHISPKEFRKLINATSTLNPFQPEEYACFGKFEDYAQQVQIQELKDYHVIYERYLGSYMELEENWFKFMDSNKDYMRENTLMIERFYDDPSITSLNQCLYDLCMTVDENCSLNNLTKINGGKFAVCHFQGEIQSIFTVLQGIFSIWLPQSGYEMTERYGLNIYRRMDKKQRQVIMDLCIPIK